MRKLFRWLRKIRFSYEPLVDVRISSSALRENVRVYKTATNCMIAPVLKSNAYGHGLITVARILDTEHAPFFVVDSYYEALILRNEGVRTPLLIIGYTTTQNIVKNSLRDVSFTIGSSEQLGELVQKPIRARVHIKVDTGMHRQGMSESEYGAALEVLAHSVLTFEGVCSHLADADGDPEATKTQIKKWNALVERTQSSGLVPRYLHVSATAGVSYAKEIHANVIRLGIGMYGFDESLPVRPVLSLHTRVTSLRAIEAGERVGYAGTYSAHSPRVIATIPVGYYEGIDRRLSNKGMVTVNDTHCPIVGRVSMNIASIDVTDVPDVQIGSPVIAISTVTKDPHSVPSIARVCDTIPYDILVHIPSTLRRTVV